MILRALLYLQIVYTVYQIHFPLDTHIPAVNVSNLLFGASLLAMAFATKTPIAANETTLRRPLLLYFATMILAFVIKQMLAPNDLIADITYLKTALFYPLLYFLYLRCGMDAKATRQMIILVMVVAVVAALQAVRQGIDYGFNGFAENHRASGPFGRDYRDANRAGVYYAMFMPMLVAITLFFRKRHLWRVCALGGMAILGSAILVTYSRQSYFIALLGLTALLLRRSLFMAGVVGIAMIALVDYLPDTVSQRVVETQQRDAVGTQQFDESTASRWEIWRGAMAMWGEHPYGIGLNHFQDLIGNYSNHRHKDAHNFYFLTLAEAGIQGLLALLLLVAALFRLAKRLRAAAPRDDPEARALAVGFTVTVLCTACGNFYGSPFLEGCVMGDFWILCGLLERSMYLRQQVEVVKPESQAANILQRFPLAARCLPGYRP